MASVSLIRIEQDGSIKESAGSLPRVFDDVLSATIPHYERVGFAPPLDLLPGKIEKRSRWIVRL